MRKALLIVIVGSCLLIGGSSAFAQGTWTQKATFPASGRSVPFCFSIGNEGYLGSGVNTSGLPLKDFWAYDQLTNTWTQKADYGGGPRWLAVGFATTTKGYAGLGQDSLGNYPTEFWEYDPAGNAWTQKANFPGVGRIYPVSFVINNKGYVSTGADQFYIPLNDLWQYDPALDLWTQKTNLPGLARGDASAFSINNKGYVAIGFDYSNYVTLSDLWEYNDVTNSWAQKASFPGGGLCDAAAFCICDKGYIGTGDTLGGCINGFWQYDPVSNTWTQKAQYGGAERDETAFFVIGNKGYIGLGAEPVWQYELYEYTPDSTASCSQCLPVAHFSSSDSDFCSEPGECIDFTDLSTCNATSWHWSFPGSLTPTSTLQNPTGICYYTAGTFPVTLIVSNAAGTDTLTVAPMIIVGGTPPPPSITVIGGDTLICSHASAYQWFLNGNAVAGATDSFYVSQQGGVYSVMITDSNRCTRLSGGLSVAAEEITGGYDVKIYPNPVSGKFTVYGLQFTTNISLEIYDVVGKKIHSVNMLHWNSGSAEVDISFLSKGLYWIQLSDSEKVYRSKVIRQ